jgi:hypothetical protein
MSVAASMPLASVSASASTMHTGAPSLQNLEGTWPVLAKAPAVPDWLINKAKEAAGSSFMDTYSAFIRLGTFVIDCNLLEAHETQRTLNNSHVEELVKSFETKGIFREQHQGVIIGCGSGWHHMLNLGKMAVRIDKSSPHLDMLRLEPNKPIGWIVRGYHRAAAVQQYSAKYSAEEGFWSYTVLHPSMSNFILQNIQYTFSYSLFSFKWFTPFPR